MLSLCLSLVASGAAAHVGEGPAIHRVNAGGSQVSGTPTWSADSAVSPSPYVNAAATLTFSTTTSINTTHASIPAGTPASIFQTERYAPPGGSEMQWNFPVTPGTYEVRLYFAEIFSGTQGTGLRVFDVFIENTPVLDNYDIFGEVGGFNGVMKPFVVTADANLDIDFVHVVENPKVSAIEILPVGFSANTLGGSPTALNFGAVVVGQSRVLALQLTNQGGSGDPNIVIDRTLISGPDASLFSDAFNDAADVTLAPGQSTNVNVTFAPTATGGQSASLEVYHSGANTPLLVPLSGDGLPVSPPGAWESRAPSGPNRQEVAYIQLGGKFYLAGGSTAHEVYDPVSNSWANLSPLPESLDHIQAVAVDGKIYYVGGLESWPSPASAQVYIYDPATNSFTQGAPMTRPRGAGGVAVYGGLIYYAGGLSAGSAVPWFDVYNPDTNTWSILPNMPVARDHFHAAVVGDKFYVTGGRNTSIDATISSTIAFDLDAGTWQTSGLEPIPTARGGFGVAVQGSEILVIGGEGGGNTFANVEAYDTIANSWRSLAPMPTPRHGIQAAECNGGVYVAAGGATQGGANPTDAHEVFFLNGATTCGPPSPPAVAAYRVNAGGSQVSGTPNWSADTAASPSPYVNAAATVVSSTTSSINTTHASIPAGTPATVFQTERYDPAGGSEMLWTFPVTPGTYEVRLYFAEIFPEAQGVGLRVFDVSIENTPVLDNYDIFAEVGGFKGVMKPFLVTADANLNITFGHVVENPKINAIEILPAGFSANTLEGSPAGLSFGSVVVGQNKVLALQLTNEGGTGDPNIVIDQTLISGTGASLFSDGFNDAANLTLAPGQSTIVNVTFAPNATGSQSATLGVHHSGTNTPLQVPLSGLGVAPTPVGFGKSVLHAVTGLSNPTSLQFGPDGRLYVGRQDGLIHAYTVARIGANNYSVTATETISLIKNIPNHDDNGAINTGITTRLITGILVVGTVQSPVVYVAHSDPRIGGGTSGSDLNLDTNSSMVSRLKWNAGSWQKLDLVRGLPRSEENHAANGMQLDAAQNILYLAMGGNTNQGATSNNFAFLPEFALSAAVLAIDLDAIGETTYDLPTLNDENRSGNPDSNDPFGGNDGKNQAILVPGGPVQVYSPGFRNPYDVVIAQSGKLYTIDNGANAGWGAVPVGEGPAGNCTNAPNEPGTTDPDSLHLITGPGYYGGHPNPTRANTANKFNTSNPQSPVPAGNPVECDYRAPGAANGALATFPASTNGLTEYTTGNFGGALQGDLIAAAWNNIVYRVDLNSTGTQALAVQALFSTVGSLPLDVQALGAGTAFPGTIWVGDYGADTIIVFEPNDFGGSGSSCSGADNPALDEDFDGYDNADEIDNGTNPCSSADTPPDWDDDLTSNLNDPDDDNDGAPDTSDPFAIDPNNGLSNALPVVYTWENDAASPGGILNLGFTGLMTNGAANYESLYDPTKMTAGGAAGVVTVDEASEGDALGSLNSQQYGFQFGVDARPASNDEFTVHTRIMGPFSGVLPEDFQSMGLYIGTGDQNNYAKITTSANGGAGGIEFVKELGGASTGRPVVPVTLPGPTFVDLYLHVDPDAATVQPRYAVTTGGVTGPVTDLGGPEPVPAGWFTNPASGLAIGILSTSRGAAPVFPATWDFIEVTVDPPASALVWDTFTRTVTNAWGTADLGGLWSILAGTAANFDVDGARGLIFTPSGGAEQLAHLGGFSARDVDAGVSMSFQSLPSGANIHYGYLLLRRQTSGAYFRIGLYVTSSGGLFIRGQTNTGVSLFSDVGTGLSAASGDTFYLRVQAEGANPTTLRARVWRAGASQPPAWVVTTTSSVTGLQTAGSVGVRTVSVGSSSSTIAFDSFVVTPIGAAPGGSTLTASPTSLGFGPVAVGQTQVLALQLTNPGSAGSPSIVVDQTIISGADASLFSDSFPDASDVTLAPGQSTAVNVTFAPTATGTRFATLEVHHSGTNTPLQVPLTGEGVPVTLPGAWETRAPASVNRHEVSYVQVAGKFYLTGDRGFVLNEAYDAATNAWGTAAPLPGESHHAQAVELSGLVYYLGGLVGPYPDHVTPNVLIFNPASNTWSSGTPMPSARARGAGGTAAHNGKLYIAGGLQDTPSGTGHEGQSVSLFDMYDPITGAWTSLPNMPRARDHFHAAVVGDKFYAIAGRKGDEPGIFNAVIGPVDVYDFTTGTWSTLPTSSNIPTPRAGTGAAVLGNEIIIIGGEGNGQAHNAVEAFNTTTGTWRSLAPMPTPRHGIQAAVCNGGIYVVGGGTTQGGGSLTNVHQVFFLNGPTTCGSPPPPPSGQASDTFTRTVTNSWGTADQGGAWSILAGTAANFDVDGTRGLVVTPNGNKEQVAHLGSFSGRDVDVGLSMSFQSLPSGGGNFYSYLMLRRQASGGAYFRIGLFVSSSGAVSIRGQTSGGASLFSDLTTGLVSAPGDTFNLRVQAEGANPTTLRARVWRAGTPEPGSWAITTTSTVTGLQTAGSVGIRTVSIGNSSTTIVFDNLTAGPLP